MQSSMHVSKRARIWTPHTQTYTQVFSPELYLRQEEIVERAREVEMLVQPALPEPVSVHSVFEIEIADGARKTQNWETCARPEQ